MQRISFEISQDTLAALIKTADRETSDVGSLIREAIERDLYRRARKAKKVHPDERSLAPLRALLADDFAFASSWPDLQDRLQAKGYALRGAGGGLILTRLDGTRLAKASDIGYSHTRLMRRFADPFPGPYAQYGGSVR